MVELEKLLHSVACEKATAYDGASGPVPETPLDILQEQMEFHHEPVHTPSELLGYRVHKCLYSFVYCGSI